MQSKKYSGDDVIRMRYAFSTETTPDLESAEVKGNFLLLGERADRRTGDSEEARRGEGRSRQDIHLRCDR